MTTILRNNIATAVTAFLFPVLSHAWGLSSDIYESKNPDLAKLVSIVKKDGRCSFAVVSMARPNAPEVIKSIAERNINNVVCVGDIVLNADTMREQSGCAGFAMNASNLSTSQLYQEFGYNIAKNKKCASGGFEDLLRDTVVGERTVAGFLSRTTDYAVERIVIYSNNPKYLTWYKTAKATEIAETKVSLKRRFLEKKEYPKYFSGYQDQTGVELREIQTGDPLLTSSEGKVLVDKIFAEVMAKNQTEFAKIEAQKKAEKEREIASQKKEKEELDKKRKKKKEVEALWKE